MGLGIETIQKTFPRSYEALQKLDKLIDGLPYEQGKEKMALKASARALVMVVADEVGGISKGIGFLRGMFGK